MSFIECTAVQSGIKLLLWLHLKKRVRIPLELDERLNVYVKLAGTTKTKVMLDALAHYLGSADDVPLIRRVLEIEERLAVLEARAKSQ